MVTEVRRRCPAKVNLYLKVVGRRPDGYHELITVMQPLTLTDELWVSPGDDLRVICDHPEVPQGDGNLVWRAAIKFGTACGREPRFHLRLIKRIPLAAGLGGGSSDAAGTLLALNELTGEPLDISTLHALAAELGADVPFFLHPGPAVGRGIGTDLSILDLPPYWYVLLNPGVSVSTAWVYANLDLEALAAGGVPRRDRWDGERPQDWVANDLENVTLKRFPRLRELLIQLSQAGAVVQGMSGSGPTLFGLFWEEEAARTAAARVRQHFPGWLAVARGLTRKEGATGWENQAWIT
ncbi:MAG: 4-(cytidine 5'-diphospho)-2-C-methyl-D-erythritol kinase [Desulfobaccales bacterium]